MSSQKSNPKQDWGYYATLPRIVRTEYRDITPIQKWLYVCLKDLCGPTGTCYRTLRVLSEETGISTGLLSESIPVLHKAGLIHAEKKKRSTGGKEVWHITIVDIWAANGLAHPTQKRSPDEQTFQNVHLMNENVHVVNNVSPECSPDERECSQIPHRSNTNRSNTMSEERRVEEKSVCGSHDTTSPDTPTPFSNDHNKVDIQPPPPKEQVNKQESLLRQQWKNHYMPRGYAEDTILNALQLRSAWLTAYGPYGDAEWDNQALLWIAQQSNGNWDNVVKVYQMWEEKEPSKPIHPEMVKNKWFWLNEKKPVESAPSALGVSGLPRKVTSKVRPQVAMPVRTVGRG